MKFTTAKTHIRWVHIGDNQWLRWDTITSILPGPDGRGSEVWAGDDEYRSPLPPRQIVKRICELPGDRQ